MILIDFIKSKKAVETLNEEELLYEFVAIELEQGAMSKGLWAKALAETEFDDLRARALYMKMRVAILREELRELMPQLSQIANTRSRIQRLLEQGCSQEAIESLRVIFPAACGVEFVDERIHTQKPQCHGFDVSLGVSDKIQTGSL